MGDTRLRPYELGCLTDLTEPIQVWPCGHCAPWHVEIFRTEHGGIGLREWHDDCCQHVLALLRDDDADAQRN